MSHLLTGAILITLYYLIIGLGIVSGFVPALMQHLKKKDIAQFGKCLLEEAQDIFVDYPENCYSAFNNLRITIESSSEDKDTYQSLYNQLCSDECVAQIKTFSQVCDAPKFTDPILLACEQNTDSGDFCLAAVYTNNGMKAAADCYSALPTGRCSEECSSSLVELKTDLGCCVNSLFNVTTYGLDKFNIASHELWDLCGLSEVPQCGNSPLGLITSSGTTIQQMHVHVCIPLAMLVFTLVGQFYN